MVQWTISSDEPVRPRRKETDPNAMRWLDGAIKSVKDQLEEAQIDEEARGY